MHRAPSGWNQSSTLLISELRPCLECPVAAIVLLYVDRRTDRATAQQRIVLDSQRVISYGRDAPAIGAGLTKDTAGGMTEPRRTHLVGGC